MIQWTPDRYCYKHSRYLCTSCRKAEEKQYDWGLFEWRADGRYQRGMAIRVYKSKTMADRAADKMDGNIVTRSLIKE